MHPGIENFMVISDSTAETLMRSLILYGERPAFGFRKHFYDAKTKQFSLDSKYTWTSYSTLHKRTVALGNGLKLLFKQLGAVNSAKRNFCGIVAVNRVEWFISDMACLINNIVSVPMLKTKVLEEDLSEVTHMLNNAECSIMICSQQFVSRFTRIAKKCPCLKVLITLTNENYDEDFADQDSEPNHGLQIFPISN